MLNVSLSRYHLSARMLIVTFFSTHTSVIGHSRTLLQCQSTPGLYVLPKLVLGFQKVLRKKIHTL